MPKLHRLDGQADGQPGATPQWSNGTKPSGVESTPASPIERIVVMCRRLSILLILIALPFIGAGHSALFGGDPVGPKPSSLATSPSFKDEIAPLFQSKCSRCHGDKAHKGDL